MNKIKLLYRKIKIKVLYYWTKLQGRDTFIIDFGNDFYTLGERIRVKAKARKLKSNYTVEASVSDEIIEDIHKDLVQETNEAILKSIGCSESEFQNFLAEKIQKDVDKEILKAIEERRKK